MKWQNTDFDWNQIRAFWAVMEKGSLSAAARALGLAQPTIGRQIAALEEKLSIVLFERVGRGLEPTETALNLLEHVREMGEAANRINLAASGQAQTVEGLVRITASDVFSANMLPPVLKKLRDLAPMIEIEVVADDAIRDLQRREADIAIRHARPTQPDLIAKLLRNAGAGLYAATSYLEQHGRPASKADLSRHVFVGFGNKEEMLGYLQPFDLPLTPENFSLGSKSGIVAWEMVKIGLGMAFMADEVAQKTPGIEPVLSDVLEPITFPLWLTAHRELHTAQRYRLVFDLLAQELAKPLNYDA